MALTGGLIKDKWTAERAERFVKAVVTGADDDEPRMRSSKGERTDLRYLNGEPNTGWKRLAEILGPRGWDIVNRVREWLGLVKKSKSAKVRTLEPYRPFPIEALPARIGNYVRQSALAVGPGCDPAYVALHALAVAASLIGNSRTIRLKKDWEEPAVVWAAVIGESGMQKSPAHNLATKYLFRLHKQLEDDFKEATAEYKTELEKHEKEKREAGEDGPEPGPPPDKPTQERVVTNDATIEKLAEILGDNPRGTLVLKQATTFCLTQ
jgi:hypothetical protein